MTHIGMILLLLVQARAQNYTDAVKALQAKMAEPGFKHASFDRLAYIVDTYGPRLWGSQQLELAIKELYEMAKKDGF